MAPGGARHCRQRQAVGTSGKSAVPEYWRRALIRIVRYSLVCGCDDGQPDLPGGGHVVLPGSGQLDYLV